MPADQLPDDHRRWPRDPRSLFGLPANFDLPTARRQYIKLIRRFKPEHYPEQFQVLRSAFELLQRSIASRSATRSPQDESLESRLPLNLAALRPHDAEKRSDAEPRPNASGARPSRSLEDEIDALWNSACAGRGKEAYWRGVRLWESGRRDHELALRLHWLLFAAPDWDQHRSSADWLFEAVVASPTGPAMRTYIRYVGRHHAEALSNRCGELLGNLAVEPVHSPLISVRWHTAARANAWDLITKDIERLRPRWSGDGRLWSDVLRLALYELLWADESLSGPLLNEYEQTVEVGHASFEQGHLLDQQCEVVGAWRERVVDAAQRHPWLPDAFASFTATLEEMEPDLSRVLADIAMRPAAQSLAELDDIYSMSGPLCDHLAGVLERAASPELAAPEPAEGQYRICEQFHRAFGDQAMLPRVELLTICSECAMDPDWFVEEIELIRQRQGRPLSGWGDQLRQDSPIRSVYFARRACGL